MPSASRKSTRRAEFGDFQTPKSLAERACKLLADLGVSPRSVVEPTCGEGTFVLSALDAFPEADKVVAVEINPQRLCALRHAISLRSDGSKVDLIEADFLRLDVQRLLEALPAPVLVLGNPPWVTNAELGCLKSANLPEKRNSANLRGMDAMTGKSNFDISEWILRRLLEALQGRDAVLAMLCKTTVARKVLAHAWRSRMEISNASIYSINAAQDFGVAVDACLLVCRLQPGATSQECHLFANFEVAVPAQSIGWRAGLIINDVESLDRLGHLLGRSTRKWRSGVKHDCSKVMELRRSGATHRNGFDEDVDIESEYLYPMLKSSDLANGIVVEPSRWMLVPQRSINEPTDPIREKSPRTWRYLETHSSLLARRASSIYNGRPRFAVFGVGDYTFSPWKVAVSGLYKHLAFSVVGSYGEKPFVLDDTCNFLPAESREEAELLAQMLRSAPARDFYDALIFWDAKRPITIDILNKLDFGALARELDLEQEYLRITPQSRQKLLPGVAATDND